jgi:hypothetical protein
MGIFKKTTQEADSSARPIVASQRTATTHQKAAPHTRITVKCNCGFPNNLYLRGEGIPGVNWEKGIKLTCVKADEWIWESDAPFKHAKFKILINDKQYEKGDNHSVDCGNTIAFTPNF